MPKTDDEKIVDALKRESFADLIALRDFFFETYDMKASAEPKDEEGANETDSNAWNVDAAIQAKYKDIVDKALRPPRAGVVY